MKYILVHHFFFILACHNLQALVWPKGNSKILVITGFGIPVDLQQDTVIVGMVIKGNYKLPTNATDLRQPFVTFARKKSLNRWDLYKMLADGMKMAGFLGKPCLLRTICELAQSPLMRNFGLFNEIFNVFFTPTSTREKLNCHRDNEYLAAQFLGRREKNCEQNFKDCPFSLLHFFTKLN